MMPGWSMIQSLIITCWCGGPFLVTTLAVYCRSSSFEEGCGKGHALGYPFYNATYYTDGHHCGYPGFEVYCRRGRPVLNISNNLYYVLNNDNLYGGFTKVVAVDVEEEECPQPTQNVTLQNTSFTNYEINLSGTLIYFYNCSSGYFENTVQHLLCLDNVARSGGLRSFAFELDKYPKYVGYDWYNKCQLNVQVPVYDGGNPNSQFYLANLLNQYARYVKKGFVLKWNPPKTDGCSNCEQSGGHCLLDPTIGNSNEAIDENICSCEGDTKLSNSCSKDYSVLKSDKCTQCERSGGICRLNRTSNYLNQTIDIFLCSCENDTKIYPDNICFKDHSVVVGDGKCTQCMRSGGICRLNQTNDHLNQTTDGFLCSCNNGTKLYPDICFKDHSVVVGDGKCTQCTRSGGICRLNQTNDHLNQTTDGFLCSCKNGTKLYPEICFKGISIGEKITIGVCIGMGSLILSIIFLYRRRWSSLSRLCRSSISTWMAKSKTPSNVELFLESVGCFGLQRYKYSEIKRITNSFRECLGQGGFGSVFKGKLQDGRLVAVKVLNELKGNGEDFINEIATIGRTNHINVVSLLGFCSSGTKRALVYEFMSNGSLEKIIYGLENADITNSHLGWEKLYQIALGIAKGLEYLHHGCNTRILHFDIKPHNILLDEDLCPKITDFGLAKLCPTRESIISMSGGRGTTGYIAPEVGNRVFGGVSHKSDVYSYGMMILEMIGGRKNLDLRIENMSEIYFPQWIYNHFQENMTVNGYEDIYKEETTKKMITVALWCIQTQPTERPSISRVVEMLEGNIEELQMPPNPFQNPPARSTS